MRYIAYKHFKQSQAQSKSLINVNIRFLNFLFLKKKFWPIMLSLLHRLGSVVVSFH